MQRKPLATGSPLIKFAGSVPETVLKVPHSWYEKCKRRVANGVPFTIIFWRWALHFERVILFKTHRFLTASWASKIKGFHLPLKMLYFRIKKSGFWTGTAPLLKLFFFVAQASSIFIGSLARSQTYQNFICHTLATDTVAGWQVFRPMLQSAWGDWRSF